jgi:uncharacterized protein YfaS (alpha-2-macroglobulin family)
VTLVPPQQAAVPAAPPRPESPAAPAPPRLREYFPETLAWQPNLVTDEHGVAELPLRFADSITTWRLTASASSREGLLGGASLPLRVYQDFFVDIDLPAALTQNDEVSLPVAVYNYLKEPQTVRIDLQPQEWFQLLDERGLSRSLQLRPNEVAAVHFRLRARQVGRFPLTIHAQGSKTSDAVKRSIDVRPDGFLVEQVSSDRLTGTATRAVVFPANAIPGASRLLVQLSPSILSQVLQGAEGMLQMPHGCFEQTSSSTYPNLLVLDYLRKTGRSSPDVLRRAERFVNAGYQRLLTFERPGGGFDWYGSGPPVLWLTALGLHEFTDMARVHPVGPAVLERTRAWLFKQQAADGSWTDGGTERKLLLTSYVAWAMAESGLRGPEVQKAIAYIRGHLGSATTAYEKALAANALAAWDRGNGELARLLSDLERHKKELKESASCCFPSEGRSLAGAWGDSQTVEMTALVALALMKTSRYPETTRAALAYLAQTRGAGGHWGSTQATVLALKALTVAAGPMPQKGTASVSIRVHGQEVRRGEVNEKNGDVLQVFDLTEHLRPGPNEVSLAVTGEAGFTYQVIGRHYLPWKLREPAASALELALDYPRTRLTTRDRLQARAALKHHGREPATSVMVELGLPPGFEADAAEFTAMVEANKVKKFELNPGRVTLYLGDVPAGSGQTFAYTLRPRYPLQAKTPASAAYEYYAPASRATAAPVELVVEDAK